MKRQKIPQVQGPYRIIEPGNRQLAALDSGFLTDVTILVGDEAIKCHSQVVSFASPKLAAIVKEKEPRLPDVDPRHFRLLLQIIYGGESCEPSDVNSLLRVGYLAHEFEVDSALLLCIKWLVSKVDAENLWEIIDFADLINAPQLEDICFKLIRDRAGYILETDGFLHCTSPTLEKILSQDTLYNVTEVELFQACVAWVNTNSDEAESRREALDSALRLIRFLLFTAEEFAEVVCPTGLLDAEAQRDILRTFVTGKDFMPEGFSKSTAPRDPSQIREIQLASVSEQEGLKADAAKNIFHILVNRYSFMYGVKLQAWRSDLPEDCLYDECVVVVLIGRENNRVVETVAQFFGQVRNGEMISVQFDHPCGLIPYVNYILCVFKTRGEEDLTLYKSDRITWDSGLDIHTRNEVWAPPSLHLLIAEKVLTP